MLTTRVVLLFSSGVAIVATLVAVSGFAGHGGSQVLLAAGAMFALALTCTPPERRQ